MKRIHLICAIFIGMIGCFAFSTKSLAADVYRAYNPYSGEHLYTPNFFEISTIARDGWNYEGIAWKAPDTNKDGVIYRLYNPNAGDHFYTADVAEKNHLINIGWRDDHYTIPVASSKTGTPIYRFYNPNARAGSHHYTPYEREREDLARAGWKYEGIGFYANN